MKGVCSLTVLCSLVLLQFNADFYFVHRKTNEMSTVKTILLWNSVNRLESSPFFGEGTQAFVRCPETRCYITTNRSSLPFDKFDAIVMNMFDVELTVLPEDWPYRRHSHQRYVALSQESPITLAVDASIFDDYFNWTMNYRTDADIPLLYGKVSSKLNQSLPHRNIFSRKTKNVVWMASHCNTDSLRESYVQQLAKHIDVDVYGTCGNLTCPRDQIHWISDPMCYDLLAQEYKFYLSFENSICCDYVTEKFFEILARNILPVVYGGANYSQLAPPHSYINAMDYTPRQLARVLHRLAANETLYNQHFRWKNRYQVEAGAEQMIRNGYCDLCRKLHQDFTPKVLQNAKSLYDWNTECIAPSSWTMNTTSSNL